jgi:hypothetical protein
MHVLMHGLYELKAAQITYLLFAINRHHQLGPQFSEDGSSCVQRRSMEADDRKIKPILQRAVLLCFLPHTDCARSDDYVPRSPMLASQEQCLLLLLLSWTGLTTFMRRC